MARSNTRAEARKVFTHEGAPAYPHMSAVQALRRSVMSCLLWEQTFYEDGVDISKRIRELAGQVPLNVLSELAIEVREKGRLRHAPLLLLRELIRLGQGSIVSETIERVIQRPDEMPELLKLYWDSNGGKKTLSAQLKKGLARAFTKFDSYQLAKYNRDDMVKLRDVLFLSHAKAPAELADAWQKLIDGNLEAPDTWEVALSAGADKKETFTRLIEGRKLGYLALLRNLRNMEQAGVDRKLIEDAIVARRGADRVLPFRFFMAAKMVPSFEQPLNEAMLAAIENTAPQYDGETIVLVDTSGSMTYPLSKHSQVELMDAAASLGAMVRGDVRCFAFATDVVEVPHRLGMAGVDAFRHTSVGWGTNMGQAVRFAERKYPNAERVILISDQQSHDALTMTPKARYAYSINVASYQNGVGYGRWLNIDGFSQSVLDFIQAYEADN